MNISKNLRSILLFFLLFIVIFYPPIVSFNLIHLVAIISYLVCMLNFRHFIAIFQKRRVLIVLIILCLMMSEMSITAFIHGNSIKSALMDAFMWVCEIVPISMSVYILCKKNQFGSKQLVDIFLVVALVQSVLSVLSFCNSSFHYWVYYKLIEYGYSVEQYSRIVSYRLYGLSHSMTFFLPVFQSFMLLIAIYMLRYSLKYFLYIPTLVFSAVVNARISIIIIVAGLIFLLFFNKNNRKLVNVSKKRTLYTGILLIISVVAFYFYYCFYLKNSGLFNNYIMAGVRSIFAFFNGKYEGYFGYFIEGDRFVLPSIKNFLLGIGADTYRVSDLIHPTDVGYINYIWMGGIIYLVLIYSLFFCLSNMLTSSKYEGLKSLGWFTIIIQFLINIKGIFFSINEFTNFLFIIAFFSYLETLEESKNNGNKNISNNGNV